MRNRTENQVTLVFIRHGETQANEERRYLGRTDESLSENGIEKLMLYKGRRSYPDVQYLFTSPMKRCLETAQILYPKISPVVIPDWEEMDFGQFEYKNYEELKNKIQYQEWIDSGGVLDFPEGESREHFISRCEKGLIKMCDVLYQIAERNVNETILAGVIVHGGTIMALLSAHDRGDYFDYQVLNGKGYICTMTGWQGRDVQEKTDIRIEVVTEI